MRILSVFSAAILAISLAAVVPARAQQSKEAESGIPIATPAVTKGEGVAPSAYVWAGTWFSNSYIGGYIGMMKMLNVNNDLWSDGFVVRADASGGSYSYNSSSTGFSSVHVRMYAGDLMLGYRKQIDNGTLSVSLGPSFEIQNNPDTTAKIRGTQGGVKVLADYTTTIDQDFQLYAQGTYATPFSVYSATGRVLYQVVDRVWVGPQATLFGNDGPYQEGTVGPMVDFKADFGEVGVVGGYRHPFTSRNADGYFASVFLGMPF